MWKCPVHMCHYFVFTCFKSENPWIMLIGNIIKIWIGMMYFFFLYHSIHCVGVWHSFRWSWKRDSEREKKRQRAGSDGKQRKPKLEIETQRRREILMYEAFLLYLPRDLFSVILEKVSRAKEKRSADGSSANGLRQTDRELPSSDLPDRSSTTASGNTLVPVPDLQSTSSGTCKGCEGGRGPNS